MATTAAVQGQTGLANRLAAGAAGGLIGGLLFGAMMGMMGMLPMVAGLAGSESALVGFGVHMGISVVIGLLFALAFGGRATTGGGGALWGLVNGALWWVLGPLVIMPLLMGMGLQFGAMLTQPMLMSLLGHLLYGVAAGVGYVWWLNR